MESQRGLEGRGSEVSRDSHPSPLHFCRFICFEFEIKLVDSSGQHMFRVRALWCAFEQANNCSTIYQPPVL